MRFSHFETLIAVFIPGRAKGGRGVSPPKTCFQHVIAVCALSCWCTEKPQMVGTPDHMARLVHQVLRNLLSAPYDF